MEIRNRMANVVKLRCNACQDFLEIILNDGWQQQLYEKAKSEIESNSRYKDKYISAYKEMRDIGVENYSVKHMDITFMSEILHSCKFMISVSNKIMRAIEQLADDRNLTDHSNENEEAEELYLRALLALCSIRKFINAVDEFEKISDEVRLKYRDTYMSQLYDLMDLIDAERIAIIQRNRQIDRDIRTIMGSEEQAEKWISINELYFNRYCNLEKDYSTYNEFVIKASDSGIYDAHKYASIVFMDRDCQEMEKRLFMMYDRSDEVSPADAKHIIDMINGYLMKGNILTEGMKMLADGIMGQGYPISFTEENFFKWEKNSR